MTKLKINTLNVT